jgi:tetratricopeptide (TPR) repeat protein
MKLFLVNLVLFLGIFSTFGQSPEHELANLYFLNGEYDKAIGYYEKFYNETQDPFFLQRYVECLTKTNSGKDAEKFLLRYIKRNPHDYLIAIYLGRFYEDEGRKEDASKHYRKLIDEMPNNANAVLELSRVFREFRMFEWELRNFVARP